MPLDLSVLDVAPIPSGATASQALANTVDLARHTEALGYTRYWLAEHHNTAGIAASVPAVLVAHVAAATTTIRVGSGGVMLPNHSPLTVAESFRLLEALHPGRIDLGIGRAPGTDGLTALALRRDRRALSGEDFPEQLGELLAFLTDRWPEGHSFSRIVASPRVDGVPQLHLLGSSGFSAQVAAQLGLGFAFASHISPGPAAAVLRHYRDEFQPSSLWPEPHSILATSAIVADDDETAEHLATSVDLAWVWISQGRSGQLPSPEEALAHPWTPEEDALRRANRSRHHVGSAARVTGTLRALADEAAADEVMVLTMVHDHEARRRSYELLAKELLGHLSR